MFVVLTMTMTVSLCWCPVSLLHVFRGLQPARMLRGRVKVPVFPGCQSEFYAVSRAASSVRA
jgi:hypothetical protein